MKNERVLSLFTLLLLAACGTQEPTATLTPEEAAGRRLFIQKGCIGCHQVGRHGGGRGPNLSYVWTRLTTSQKLAGDTYAGTELRGMSREERAEWWLNRHLIDPTFDFPYAKMPVIPMTETERRKIVAYLKTLRAPTPKGKRGKE